MVKLSMEMGRFIKPPRLSPVRFASFIKAWSLKLKIIFPDNLIFLSNSRLNEDADSDEGLQEIEVSEEQKSSM